MFKGDEFDDIFKIMDRAFGDNTNKSDISEYIDIRASERVMDEDTGKLLTTNIHDYKLPTIKDILEIEVISVNEGDPLISSTGAKGCGEPAHIPTAGAIANAIYNAIGVRIKSAPMTPDKVLMALQNKN